jgi:hypothetical protein
MVWCYYYDLLMYLPVHVYIPASSLPSVSHRSGRDGTCEKSGTMEYQVGDTGAMLDIRE